MNWFDIIKQNPEETNAESARQFVLNYKKDNPNMSAEQALEEFERRFPDKVPKGPVADKLRESMSNIKQLGSNLEISRAKYEQSKVPRNLEEE